MQQVTVFSRKASLPQVTDHLLRDARGTVVCSAKITAAQNVYGAVLPQKINNDSTTNKVDLNLSDKNRVFDGVITLPAGNYVLRYRSDGTHSYNDWNTDPPDDPESWGIAVFRLARR